MNCQRCTNVCNSLETLLENLLFDTSSDASSIISMVSDLKKKYFDGVSCTTTGISQDITDLNIHDNWKDKSKNRKIVRRQKKSDDEIFIEIKKKLEDSLVKNDIECNLSKTEDMNQCITSIKMLEATIKTYDKKILQCFCEIGTILKKMQNMNYQNFMDHLKKNNILYSKATVHLYIKLSKLADKHPKIKNCSVSIHFVNMNFRFIKEICKRNHW